MGLISSANDCSSGGLLIAVAEMCMLSGLGSTIDISKCPSSAKRWDEIAFSESHSRFVITASKANSPKIAEHARKNGAKCTEIGTFKGKIFDVVYANKKLASPPVEKMKYEWETAIPRLMGDAK